MFLHRRIVISIITNATSLSVVYELGIFLDNEIDENRLNTKKLSEINQQTP